MRADGMRGGVAAGADVTGADAGDIDERVEQAIAAQRQWRERQAVADAALATMIRQQLGRENEWDNVGEEFTPFR